ncbi:MAG: beta-methylgalactoside transporter [Clostridiaceae bacterium]|nr:beta-methylgalactoside transporter [Clostridiaceae bacterium]
MSTEKVKKNSKWSSEQIKDFLINNALILIMLVLVIYVTATRPEFLKPTSLINLLSLTAAYLPVALGIAGCIVLTGTDLSAGRVVGITAVISASLLQDITAPGKMWPNLEPPPIALVLLISVLIGALIGAFNGFWVAKFKLHPFIVTLATQLIVYTFILLYMQAGESTGQAISSLTEDYREFVTGSVVGVPIGGGKTAPIPNYVWLALLLAGLMWLIWNKTTFGKNMFALGANEEAARVSGVNVFATTIIVFALAGAMYGYAGFIESARIASNTANTGANYELDAIAACVIGGVSFVGGIGSISGIVIGVLLLRLIFVALPMIGMDQNLQFAIKGGIILLACALDMRKYLEKK